MAEERSLQGKAALVTGGAHRIGARICEHLHAAGMDVAVHYHRSEEAALAIVASLEARRPGSAVALRADLDDPAALPQLIESVHGRFGRLDALVNNASRFYPTPVGSATQTQWDDLMGSNLRAPFFLAQAAAPLLRTGGGCIVNLVDIHAQRPLKDHPIYCMAKAANAMMVRSLARELGPEVRVNGVAPGAILWPDTPMGDASKQEILGRTALRRTGTPDDIARAVLFLVRDADYTTGQILAVDGGRTVQQ
jgi:pteridine reductase